MDHQYLGVRVFEIPFDHSVDNCLHGGGVEVGLGCSNDLLFEKLPLLVYKLRFRVYNLLFEKLSLVLCTATKCKWQVVI